MQTLSQQLGDRFLAQPMRPRLVLMKRRLKLAEPFTVKRLQPLLLLGNSRRGIFAGLLV